MQFWERANMVILPGSGIGPTDSYKQGKPSTIKNAWLYGVMESKNVVIMKVNGAKTATNSKWGRKS